MDAAISGNTASFTMDLGRVDWVGAWPEIFREIVRVGFVHTSIRLVFSAAWRGDDNTSNGSDILAERMSWSLSRDFEGQLDLLVASLRLLMPETAVTRPVYAFYRGQSLAEHQVGRHGCWWTPEPVRAELFGLMPNRTRSGAGTVVVAFAPEDAIITTLDRTEFLVKTAALAPSGAPATKLKAWGHEGAHLFSMLVQLPRSPDGLDGAGDTQGDLGIH